MVKHNIVNPANALTSTRLVVLPVIVWAMWNHHVFTTMVLLIYSGVVDLIDGSVARYFRCASSFGEMLDAISDAGLFLVVSITAAFAGYVEPLPVIVFLAAGAINALGRVIYIRRVGRITNFRSYASEVIGGTSFFMLVGILLDFYADIAVWCLAILTVVVVVHDYWRILTLPVTRKV